MRLFPLFGRKTHSAPPPGGQAGQGYDAAGGRRVNWDRPPAGEQDDDPYALYPDPDFTLPNDDGAEYLVDDYPARAGERQGADRAPAVHAAPYDYGDYASSAPAGAAPAGAQYAYGETRPDARAASVQAPRLNGHSGSGVTAEMPSGTGVLGAFGLGKSYGGRQVVRDASLNVRRGEAVGLLGPNGAGKTTIFYMITGLVKADAGRIELDGHDVTHLPMYRRARLGVGYLPQEASIFRGLSVENNIRAVLEMVEPNRRKREEELDGLLEEFRVTHVRKSPAIALSGGERRRVEIARALATRPTFMLLDEPFAGIDPIAVGDIQTLVRHLTERGIGVLITDHNVRETLGLIDRAYIIHSGTVLMEGQPDEIVSSSEVRRLYLGEEFRL